jgi:5-methylcytosine-specific restriction endonuclease McrA
VKLRPVRRLHGLCLYCGRPSRVDVCGYCSDLPVRDPLVSKARLPLTESERTMRRPPRIYQTSLWKRTRKAVLERDGYRCRLELSGCTTRATTVDHVTPLSQGGRPYDPTNLVAACRHCNTSKADLSVKSVFQRRQHSLPALGSSSPSRRAAVWGAIRP